jgi:hypothetical protein
MKSYIIYIQPVGMMTYIVKRFQKEVYKTIHENMITVPVGMMTCCRESGGGGGGGGVAYCPLWRPDRPELCWIP